MVSPDIFERAQHAPDTLTPIERVIFGVASIQAAMGNTNIELTPSQRTELLSAAVGITQQGLKKIRTNPQFSEAERFKFAVVALGGIDWKAMEPTPEMAGLLGETMLTLAAGQKTRIRERTEELQEGIVNGFYEAGALLMLGGKRVKLSAVDQVRQLQDADLYTPEQRKTVALAWAKHLISEVDDGEFGKMVAYFGQQNDKEAVLELSMAKLEAVAKRSASETAESTPK